MQSKTVSKGPRNKMSTIFLWVMLALPVLNWIVFWFIVNCTSIVIAFQDVKGAFSFINFKLFWTDLTSPSGELLMALGNTLKYFVVADFIVFPITICCCYFFFKKIGGYKAFRIIFYLPAIISPVVMTSVYSTMIANSGPVGYLLLKLGANLPAAGLLGSPETATNTIIIYTMWTGVCTKMLIISGSMARIPIEVLESAKLDGVSIGGELIYMIIPLMWPTISTLVIMSLTGLLTASGPILLFSSQPYNLKTITLSYWIFDKVYAGGSVGVGKYGLVAATGLIFTIVLIPIVYGARWLVEKVPSVEY